MSAAPDLQSDFEFGPFQVVPDRNIVSKDGVDAHLEPKQMKALLTLARHQPGVVSKQDLVNEVWDGRATSDESITGCIKGLRAALDNDSPRSPKYIETIHGRGYRLIVPIIVSKEAPARIETSRNWLPGMALAIVLLATAAYWFLKTPQPAPASIDSVVITRFANMSSEAAQPTVDGITEQLISTLYEVPNLQIRKGNLPDENESTRGIADRYGVGWVVFGSVQQMSGQIKIIARIEYRDGVVEWAGTFTGTDQEVFALHEQVATKVRDAIRGEEEETVSAASKPTNSEAYGNYLLGKFYLAKRNRAALDQAMLFFIDSIEGDPGYGPAYLALANTYMLLADYHEAREDMFDLAIGTAEEGARHDPKIYQAAQTVHGYVHSKRGNWTAATAAFDIATNSAAEYPPSHHYHSVLMAAVGRVDDSLDAALRAWEMDPDSQVLNSQLAISYFWKNDMERARRFYAVANTMGQGAPIHQLSYALFLVRDDRTDEAREVVRRAMMLFRTDPSWVDPVFDELARSPASEAMTSVLQEYAAQNIIPPNVLMTFWAMAGQADRAMEIAWQFVDEPGLADIQLIYLDEFRGLRRHDDFARFAEQLGLTDYWKKAGCRLNDDQLSCETD